MGPPDFEMTGRHAHRMAVLTARLNALALSEIGMQAMEAHLGLVETACANLDRPVVIGVRIMTGANMFERMGEVYDSIARGGTIEVPQQGTDVVAPMVESFLSGEKVRRPWLFSGKPAIDPEVLPGWDLLDEATLVQAITKGEPFKSVGSDLTFADGALTIPCGAIIRPVAGRPVPTAHVSPIFIGSLGSPGLEIAIDSNGSAAA